MPDLKPPADGDAGSASGALAGGEPPKLPEPPKPLSLTQEDLDRIIAERVRRAVPADYEDLKGKATKYDEAQAASKSELEKAQEKVAKAEAAAVAATTAANATLVRAAILAEAATQNAIDPATVVALLAGSDAITVENGEVKGAKQAVTAILKEKSFLVKAAMPGASGGQFGGIDPKTKAQKIADLEAKANDPKLSASERNRILAEARVLKLG